MLVALVIIVSLAVAKDDTAVPILESSVNTHALPLNIYNLLSSFVSYHNELAGIPTTGGSSSCLNTLGLKAKLLTLAVMLDALEETPVTLLAILVSGVATQEPPVNIYSLLPSLVSYHKDPLATFVVPGSSSCLNIAGFNAILLSFKLTLAVNDVISVAFADVSVVLVVIVCDIVARLYPVPFCIWKLAKYSAKSTSL